MTKRTNAAEAYRQFIDQKEFPCVAAKAALNKDHIHCLTAGHIACPADDYNILQFLYGFIDAYRQADNNYYSAAVIFTLPEMLTEAQFDEWMWQRLQSLCDMDAIKYGYDKRVNNNPVSPDFSFSLKEEAFFIIGLHPGSSRNVRRFQYPALVFNPHQQFQELKQSGKYANLQKVVRKRDLQFSGSVNPMLHDFGEASEVYQYSGRQYSSQWKCPLQIKHEQNTGNTAA